MPLHRLPRPLALGASAALVLLAGWAGLNAVLAYQPSTDTLAELVGASGETAPPAPDFALETIAGETFRLSEQRGRVVVLNFWATWCAPCRYEIPDFVALQEEFGTDDVVFVGVSTERRNRQGVAHFAEEMEITYPIGVDDGSADRAYGPILALPTTFLIDRAGRVRAHVPGMVAREMLEPALRALLLE